MPPAKKNISINLLTQDDFSSSALGRVLLWALSIGRYIVVFTELVVVLAFLSRFKLDRDLTNLNKSIDQKVSIIQSYESLEPRFSRLQQQLELVDLINHKLSPKAVFDILAEVQPLDVRLDRLSFEKNNFRIEGTALSPQAFNNFIRSLSAHERIEAIALSSVSSEDQGLTIVFEMEATIKEDL